MSRITVTNKGRLLQQELLKDVVEESFTLKQRDTASLDWTESSMMTTKSPQKGKTPRKLEGVILGQMTINETIKCELQDLDNENISKNQIVSEELVNNKFLQAKIAKLNTALNKESFMVSTPKKSEKLPLSLPQITQTLDRGYGSNNYTDSTHNMSYQSRAGSQAALEYTDRFGVDQYPKILYYESTITRLIERHNDNKKKFLKTAKQVLDNFDKKIRQHHDQNHKPPELLESMREKNPDAVDVLLRSTRSQFRKNNRLNTYWKEKYQPYQARYSDLTTKRFENHMAGVRHFKNEAKL